ncbi:MAG: pilus assembly protein [Chloroflexi bacterium]|nr:pilus assembly protein [Chloroflexota bacterium]
MQRVTAQRGEGPSPAKGQRGQAMVEFAFVIVALTLVMVGIIDFGRLYFSYASIANAAREGARYGLMYPARRTAGDWPDPDNIAFRTRAMMHLLGASSEIQITFPDGCENPGCRIRVKVSSQFDMWTPIIPAFQLVGESTMYIEE